MVNVDVVRKHIAHFCLGLKKRGDELLHDWYMEFEFQRLIECSPYAEGALSKAQSMLEDLNRTLDRPGFQSLSEKEDEDWRKSKRNHLAGLIAHFESKFNQERET